MKDRRFINYNPSTVTFYNQNREMLLKEITLLALDVQTGSVLATGKEAQQAYANENIAVGSPFRNGVVAEFELARKLIKDFLKKAVGGNGFLKPKIAVCVPKDITQVENQAFRELMYSVGAKSGGVMIIEDSFQKALRIIPDSYKIIIEICAEIE